MSYSDRPAFPFLVLLLTAFLSLPALMWPLQSEADQLTLTWTDNSTTESGFAIERATGQAGTFAQVATVVPNVTSYTDSTVTSGTTYCYRVRAFSDAGGSPYSNQACGTTAVPPPTLTTPPASPPTASTPDPTGWTRCATEGEMCAFTGTQEVRYGENSSFTAPQTFGGGTACTNAVFGDPLVGVLKHCERRDPVTASPPSPPPPTTTTPPPTATTPPPLTPPTVTSTPPPVDPGPSSLPSPTDLKARVRRHWVVLRWDDNSTGERGFVIERALGTAAFRTVGLMGRGQTRYVELLGPDGRYRYRVRALGQGGQLSDPSNAVEVVID